MGLSQAIVYYIFAFVLTLAFIILGCFIGVTLRKRKDAKNASENGISAKDSIDDNSSEK